MELYLSRIQLNPFSKSVMRDVGNPRELHRTVSACFPAIDGEADVQHNAGQTPRSAYKVLHRLDQRGDEYVLYVQSTVEPDWHKLRHGYARDIAVKPVHDLYANISNGDVLQFRLQANPTKRVGKSDASAKDKFKQQDKRRRVDIRTQEGRIKWLEDKGKQSGFRIVRLRTDQNVPNLSAGMQPALRFKHDKGPVTLGTSIFEGTLEVTDKHLFLNALTNGIGPGKAYGFGLMSVARA